MSRPVIHCIKTQSRVFFCFFFFTEKSTPVLRIVKEHGDGVTDTLKTENDNVSVLVPEINAQQVECILNCDVKSFAEKKKNQIGFPGQATSSILFAFYYLHDIQTQAYMSNYYMK